MPYKTCLNKYKDNLVQQKHLRSLRTENLSPRVSKDRPKSVACSANRESLQTSFPLENLVEFEKALYNGNLNDASQEYCGRLRSIANLILDRLNE